MPIPTYDFYGPGETRAAKDPTDADLMQAILNSLSHLYEALNHIINTESASYPGTWQNPIIEGGTTGKRRWYDTTTGLWRTKNGSNPSTETDGNMVIEG